MSSYSIQPTSNGVWGIKPGSSPMLRALPEPRSTLGSWVSSAASAVAQVATTAFTGNPMLDSAQDFSQLFATQLEVQREMQYWTMASNIARSSHETEMAPVRNMRVG